LAFEIDGLRVGGGRKQEGDDGEPSREVRGPDTEVAENALHRGSFTECEKAKMNHGSEG
jgi:hypothetical protein